MAITDEIVKRVTTDYLDHKGERSYRVTRRGAELWEDHAPAIRFALEQSFNASADESERLRALALDYQKAYLQARQEAFEEAAKISETWRCSLRPGNSQRLLGHQDAAAQIAAAIRIASQPTL